ncbi:bifunctional NAD(P)H-hydrate repair enzyme Nnr [Compostibacillus humi]|uniref:Bifunctional NAD(P)H-hydrate repair enzyme n=1 Tax=Compostibacillus humi TaxID=1245525 RepID=A0A8J2TP77_9BACI|nr:NAD(P)H-hydrate dehydratase [Compostibacillus humi]GFZ78099.1 bifunctional NAD(P)H-hydrate repair enzyme Nnr [Compostibacillus humi]
MFIVTAKEMYDIDRYTMDTIGLEGKILMENAGRAIAEKIKQLIRKDECITIFIGPGNNGGDGFVIARTLLEENYDLRAVQVVPDEKITGDAFYHKQVLIRCGGTVITTPSKTELNNIIRNTDIIIDAVLGIGTKGPLRQPIKDVVQLINDSNAVIFSVDIPSGLPADEGLSEFTAVKADQTFVVGAPKVSAFLPHTAPYYGKWQVVSIGFLPRVMEKFTRRKHWNKNAAMETLPNRDPYAHKGHHGRGLIIGGSLMMPGAITMTAKAALRAGAGLITAATVPSAFSAIQAHCPEAMCFPLEEKEGWIIPSKLQLDAFNAIAIGIGMGRFEESGKFVAQIVEQAKCPLIIDADGLHHLTSHLNLLKERSFPTVITPHPKEMARLLDVSVKDVLLKPFYFSAAFAEKYGVYVVLKGKHTVITSPESIQAVNDTGNQGLAKGGSGDVLTGIILAMVMQKQPLFTAICNACFIHGKAADLQIDKGHTYYDLLATDVIEGIPDAYRTISNSL